MPHILLVDGWPVVVSPDELSQFDNCRVLSVSDDPVEIMRRLGEETARARRELPTGDPAASPTGEHA